MNEALLEKVIELLLDVTGGTDFTIIKTSALTGLKLRKIVILEAAVISKLDSGANDIHTMKGIGTTSYPAGTIFPFNNLPITAITLTSGLAIGYN